MRKYSLITAKQGNGYVAALSPIVEADDPTAVYLASEVEPRLKALEDALRTIVLKAELFDVEDEGLSKYDPAVLDAKRLLASKLT